MHFPLGVDCSLKQSFALWSRFDEHINADLRPPKLTSHASLVYNNHLWLFGGYNFLEDVQFWFYKLVPGLRQLLFHLVIFHF